MKVCRCKEAALVGLLSALLPFAAGAKSLARGHVLSVIKDLSPTGDLPAETELHLAIGLPLQNTGQLETLLGELYDPASPNYHHYLTPEQFTRRFGPTEKQYQTVIAFARAHHLTTIGTHPNRMLLDVSGSAANVEKMLSVHLRTYHRPDGNGDFFAPDTEPTAPDDVPVLDVSGLNNFRPPHPHFHRITPADKLERFTPNLGSGAGGTYMGNDFRAAYVPGVALNGSGQAVGLLEFDGFYASDMSSYQSKAGLPSIPVQTVLLDGYNGTPTSGSQSGNPEVSLDIEMVMSMSPGVTNIISYEAGPTGNPNDLLNRMATDNIAKQLACSWSWSGGPSATTDQIFQAMAAHGQSFFCASGDSDAYPAGALDNAANDDTPSDSPYITIVGATTLTTSGPGGAWVSEKVWNWNNGTGSSGGISTHYGIPVWQQGISMSANGGSAAMRNIPDVALTGDNVFVTYGNGESGSFGGTSCAAPLWAAFTALVNEQLAAYNQSPLGFANPSIYALGKGNSYTGMFHDITTGNNTSSASSNAYYATAGYDLCTGWGTPGGAALIDSLAPMPDSLEVLPGAGFTSTGLVGGSFTVNAESFLLTNIGSTAIGWSLANTSAWLTVSASGGTLTPGGTAAPVTVNLNATAAALPVGTNVANLWFTNLSTGYVVTRQFVLTITSQLLANEGFETGNFSGWTESGTTNAVAVTSSATYVHSGKYGAELGPNGSMGYLSQTVPTMPGRTYVVSFWLKNPAAGTPNQFTATWNGTPFYNQSNLPALAWTNLQYVVTASSTSAVLQFGFRNDPSYFGLDDVSILPLAAPSLRALTKQNATVQFALSTTPGLTYQIQYTTNLFNNNWINLGQPFTAANSSTVITDSEAVDVQRFYRALVQP